MSRDEALVRAALEAAAKECEQRICGAQGFAGPSCCILRKGHDGPHAYGTPMASTAEQCADSIHALDPQAIAASVPPDPEDRDAKITGMVEVAADEWEPQP